MADALGDYGYTKTADATSLNSASLTGFPAFVRLESGTDSTGTGAGVLDSSASIDGKEDIGFFDENGNLLDYYWVTFDPSNGVFEAWVLTDLVRDGSTQIKVGYGSGNSDDSSTESTVWDGVNGMFSRWGLVDDIQDSTSNNRDGTEVNNPQQSSNGPFGGSYAFENANNEYIDIGDINNPNVTTILTWFYPSESTLSSTSINNNKVIISDWSKSSGDRNNFFKAVDSSGNVAYYTEDGSGNSDFWSPVSTPFSGQAWNFGAVRNDPNGNKDIWADSSQVASKSSPGSSDASEPFGIGGDESYGTDAAWDGKIAEVQVYSTYKSDDFLQSQYEMSPEAGFSLFSWNASEKASTVSQSQPGTVTVTGTQASNTATSTSNSGVSKVKVSGIQAITGTYAMSVGEPGTVTVSGTQASNLSSATSNSSPGSVSVKGLVSGVNVIEAPPIKFRKPRARVKLIESEDGTEHTLISTDDGSSNYLQGDIDIDSSVDDAVDTFEFTLTNPNDRFSYISADDEVVIELGYNTPLVEVFRGKVTKPQKEFGDSGAKINISGQDFGQILQVRKAAEVYLDETVEFILKDLIRKYCSELDESGIQGPGKTVKSKRIAYSSIFDVIENFADRFNYQFYVDNDKVVHFEPKGFDASNHVFTEGEQLLNFDTQPNKEKLINEAIIFGGSQSVRENEKKDGDGGKTVFTTTFKPHDPDIYVDGNHLQGGVAGTTSLSEADYVYDVDKKEIEFASAPGSGTENVEISYSRTIPIQAIVRDQASIDEYGLSQFQDTDQNIQKQEEAKDIAQSLVDDFKQPPEEASAEIVAVHELTAGQSATFDVPSAGVSSEVYDIVSLNYTWGESGFLMSMNLNEEPRKLKDILKNLKNDVKRTKGYDSGILDLIRKIQTYSDSINMDEALDLDSRQVNDSFIIGHSGQSTVGTDKLGDRRGTYNDRVTK